MDRGRRVLAALAPGLMAPVEIASWRVVDLGAAVTVASGDFTVALDGECELAVGVIRWCARRWRWPVPGWWTWAPACARVSDRASFELAGAAEVGAGTSP